MDMIFQGLLINLFQASQQGVTMSSCDLEAIDNRQVPHPATPAQMMRADLQTWTIIHPAFSKLVSSFTVNQSTPPGAHQS
jgi:hypothetical protein